MSWGCKAPFILRENENQMPFYINMSWDLVKRFNLPRRPGIVKKFNLLKSILFLKLKFLTRRRPGGELAAANFSVKRKKFIFFQKNY